MGNIMQHLSEEHTAGTTEEWLKRIIESDRSGMVVPMWTGVLKGPTCIARVDEAHFTQYLN